MENNDTLIHLLYELSLSNLKHKSPKENASKFVKKLLSRKALNYGAVWLFDEKKNDSIQCSVLYSIPFIENKINLNTVYFKRLFKDNEIAFTSKSIFLNNELEGYFAYLKLGTIGVLELFTPNDSIKLSQDSLYPLLDVVDQLASSIESGFAFEKLQFETKQRKAAELSAINSEAKYRKIIDNIHLGLLEVDNDEKILFANDSFLKLTEYALEDLLGMKASEVLVSEDDLLSKKRLKNENQKREKGESSFYEIPIITKSGIKKWAIISGAPIKDGRDRIIGSIGIHLDITDKKNQEIHEEELLKQFASQNEKLQEKQNYLKAINDFASKLIGAFEIIDIVREITENTISKFDFVDCVVYLFDENRASLIQVAAHGAKNKGGAVDEPLKLSLGEGIVGSVAQSGQPEIVNDTTQDSRYVRDVQECLSELAVPIISEGEVLGVIDSEHPLKNYYNQEHLETLTTIASLAATKIKNEIIREKGLKVEKALFDSENKLRSIINSAFDSVITINSAGIITEWNDQAEVMFGFARDHALGEKLSTLIIPHQHREGHTKGMKNYEKTGKTVVSNKRIEITALHSSGEEFPIELSVKPISMGGVTFFSAFARDITKQKKAEKEVQEALDKQKELNRMKSQFVAMTSHEFRTPLTSIQINTELLAVRLKKESLSDGNRINKSLSRISSELERLTTLMNEVLLMSKIESGNIQIKPKAVKMSELIKDIMDRSNDNQHDGRKIDFNIHGKEINVLVDENYYIHALSNLISNAFKYSIGAKNPKLDLYYRAKYFQIKIKDYGIGIPKEDISNLHNSFFRSSNVGNIQGTGLGLTIVKEFIDLHGGKINVTSEIDKGTTFVIDQPYLTN